MKLSDNKATLSFSNGSPNVELAEQRAQRTRPRVGDVLDSVAQEVINLGGVLILGLIT